MLLKKIIDSHSRLRHFTFEHRLGTQIQYAQSFAYNAMPKGFRRFQMRATDFFGSCADSTRLALPVTVRGSVNIGAFTEYLRAHLNG